MDVAIFFPKVAVDLNNSPQENTAKKENIGVPPQESQTANHHFQV